jgi:hypothetical protein
METLCVCCVLVCVRHLRGAPGIYRTSAIAGTKSYPRKSAGNSQNIEHVQVAKHRHNRNASSSPAFGGALRFAPSLLVVRLVLCFAILIVSMFCVKMFVGTDSLGRGAKNRNTKQIHRKYPEPDFQSSRSIAPGGYSGGRGLFTGRFRTTKSRNFGFEFGPRDPSSCVGLVLLCMLVVFSAPELNSRPIS